MPPEFASLVATAVVVKLGNTGIIIVGGKKVPINTNPGSVSLSRASLDKIQGLVTILAMTDGIGDPEIGAQIDGIAVRGIDAELTRATEQ